MWMYRILCGTRLRTFWMNIPGMLCEADHRTIDLRRVCISWCFRDWCFTSLPLHPHQHSLLLILRGGGVQVRVNCRCHFSGIIALFPETGTLSNLGNTNSAKRASQKVPGTQSAPRSGAGITSACHHFWRVKLQSSNSTHTSLGKPFAQS